MIRAYLSEWLKLRRPSMILGGAGAMIGFAILAVVLTLSRLGATGGPGGSHLTAAQVTAYDGFSQLMANSATFIGVVALAVCAISVGMEYTNGTMRNLLVRQSNRLHLLTGKLLAVASFVTIAAVAATAAALITAVLLAPSHALSISAWFTGEGVRSLLAGTGNVVLSTLAWSVIGAAVAMVLRSTTAAIAGGLAYALVVENLLSAAWSGGKQWLPGQLIGAVAQGGTSSVAYATALALVAAYACLALGAAGVVFRFRDVAA